MIAACPCSWNLAPEKPLEYLEIPYKKIESATLTRLLEEFVSRDGTDYGHQVVTIEEKVRQVLQLLQSGRARLLFNPESETCSVDLV